MADVDSAAIEIPTAEPGEHVNTPETPAVKAQERFSIWRQCRALCRMHPKRLASVLMRTYSDWSADGATRLGAALAYYTLFSIAPVLIVITGVIGFFVGQAAAREELTPWLQRFLSPEGARAAELMLQQHVTPAGGIITTLIGLVTLFLATSAFVNELRQSINLVWRVQLPPSENQGLLGTVRAMLTDRVYAFLLAIGAAVLVMVSVIINTTITVAGSYFNGALPLPAPALHLINFVISFLLMVSVFTLVYKTLPDAYVAWGDAAVGAIVTAFLFDVGSLMLSTFIGHTGDSPYGTAASVLAMLAWVYYSAQVFFFGAELTRIFATTYGGGIIPVHRSLSRHLWQPSRRRFFGRSTVADAPPESSARSRPA
jgi:membrane protein